MAIALLAALGSPAAAQDTVGGDIRCNNQPMAVRGAIARWDGKDQVNVQLFDKPPTAETHRLWAARPIGRGGEMPAEHDSFASVTFTLKPGATELSHETLKDYHFYINCPTLQMNFNRGTFTKRGVETMKATLPTFGGRLGSGGRLQLASRGTESMGIDAITKATWDFRLDAPVAVMK
jgi:hypothetical protein